MEPRKAYGKAGATVLPNYRLSDHLFPDDVDRSSGQALLDSIPLVPSDGDGAADQASAPAATGRTPAVEVPGSGEARGQELDDTTVTLE